MSYEQCYHVPRKLRPMDKLGKILRRIDSLRDEMVDMQIRLSSFPAISPANGGQGEFKKAQVILDYIKENGYDTCKVVKAPDLDADQGCRPNILATFGGKNRTKTIWIMSHLDVVPPGELSLWRGNPFRAWVEEGKIYGRGTEDNQQDMVGALLALKAFRTEGIKPNYNVGLAMVSDEETGSEKGIRYVLEHDNPFQKQDLIIVPDAGNPEGTLIEVAEKSILWVKFTTYGKQAHGSTPEKGINSFRAASYLVRELDNLYKKFAYKDPIFDPPISTFEPTKKEANVPNTNTIPGEDVFYMDCRILPNYNLDEVREKMGDIILKIEEKFQVQIVTEEDQTAPAAPPTPTQAQVVLALKKAVKDIYGKEARPTGIGGGTIAGLLRCADYEAACWSRTDETAHQPNEYCVIDNMVGDAKVFAHIFLQP